MPSKRDQRVSWGGSGYGAAEIPVSTRISEGKGGVKSQRVVRCHYIATAHGKARGPPLVTVQEEGSGVLAPSISRHACKGSSPWPAHGLNSVCKRIRVVLPALLRVPPLRCRCAPRPRGRPPGGWPPPARGRRRRHAAQVVPVQVAQAAVRAVALGHDLAVEAVECTGRPRGAVQRVHRQPPARYIVVSPPWLRVSRSPSPS
jgi:hypothetical protein